MTTANSGRPRRSEQYGELQDHKAARENSGEIDRNREIAQLPRTTAALELGRAVARAGRRADVSKRLGIPEASLRDYESGRRVPAFAARTKLATLGIDPSAWDAPAGSMRHLKRRIESREREAMREEIRAAVSTASATTEDLLTAQIDRLLELQRVASGDDSVSMRDRVSLEVALNGALARRARLRGEDQASVARILASPHWKQIERGYARAIEKLPASVRAMVARTLAAELRRLREEEATS